MRWVHDLAVEMSGDGRELEMFPAQRALRNREEHGLCFARMIGTAGDGVRANARAAP